MKNKKIGIIALVIFMIVIVSQNIMLMNKTNKLIGSSIGDIKYTDYLKASNVDYTSKKTVQNAIDEIYASASESFLDRMYPIGSIYISTCKGTTTTTCLATAEDVAKQLGGTWESYGSGKMLVGIDTSDSNFNTDGKTAGSKTINLAHSHTVNEHDHTMAHTHNYGIAIPTYFGTTNNESGIYLYNGTWVWKSTSNVGSQTVKINSALSGSATTNTIAATGATSATSASSAAKTGKSSPGTNSQLSSSQSILNPYITVYMYKRIN